MMVREKAHMLSSLKVLFLLNLQNSSVHFGAIRSLDVLSKPTFFCFFSWFEIENALKIGDFIVFVIIIIWLHILQICVLLAFQN